MRLRLVRPMRQKGSSNLIFVKRIPAGLRERLQGRVLVIPLGEETVSFKVTPSTQSIRFSLRTSNPGEAKVRQAEALVYVEQYLNALRGGRELELTHRQITALAGEFYAAWAQGPDRMRSLTFVPSTGELFEGAFDDEYEEELLAAVSDNLAEKAEAGGDEYLLKTYGPVVDRMLAQHGIPEVTPKSRARLVSAFSRYLTEGLRTSSRIAGGDYSHDVNLSKFPAWENPIATGKTTEGVSIKSLVEDWWTEAKAVGKSESTNESYTNSFRLLRTFLGHDDALRVTPQDIVSFKDHRLSAINPKTNKAVSAKTVKASDLTAFKSVFDWAVSNLRMPSNPAAGVTVKLGKKVKVRERDFTDAEAKALLLAANAVSLKPRMNQTELAKRWVPWLCAYTGSRVGEMVQLRKEDIRLEGDAWVVTITPEAGTVKGKELREIPLHPHLIEMGFTAFVKASGAGYLFMTIKPDSSFRGVWQSKKNRLADFARLTVKDPNVAPNHGWRHTFKMKGFEAGVQEKVLDAICGHSPGSVGREYGSVSLKTKVDAMEKFPRYAIGEHVDKPMPDTSAQ